MNKYSIGIRAPPEVSNYDPVKFFDIWHVKISQILLQIYECDFT